jgi:hypothetical protein
MKSSVCVALVSWGALCILSPWLYEAYYLKQVTDFLATHHMDPPLPLPNMLAGVFPWFIVLAGLAMIALGVNGARMTSREAGK